jgi:hypothetical protein
MEASFWYRKWKNGEIGFYKSETNPLLIESKTVVGGLKGVATIETVWLLQKAK